VRFEGISGVIILPPIATTTGGAHVADDAAKGGLFRLFLTAFGHPSFERRRLWRLGGDDRVVVRVCVCLFCSRLPLQHSHEPQAQKRVGTKTVTAAAMHFHDEVLGVCLFFPPPGFSGLGCYLFPLCRRHSDETAFPSDCTPFAAHSRHVLREGSGNGCGEFRRGRLGSRLVYNPLGELVGIARAFPLGRSHTP
jgi:hypothetical protein